MTLSSRTMTTSVMTMSSSAVAAVVQMTCNSDIKQNLEQAGQLVTRAKKRGADMVFLPEVGRNE